MRLLVRATNGVEETVFRRFVVDNTPPSVAVAGIVNGDELAVNATDLRVDVVDEGGVAEVAYELDGKLIGVVRRAPFSLPWTAGPGAHELRAIATDRAGNKSASDLVVFDVQ